jgi:hypothetical protein
VVFYKPGQKGESLPKIIVPVHPEKGTEMAASLLTEKIVQGLKKAGASSDIVSHIKVQYVISQEELNRSALVFSIGKSVLYKKYREFLPVNAISVHDQGYFIFTSNDLPNVIFLAGNNETGDYYASATAVQLFDQRIPIFYNARIIDFPDMVQRCFSIEAWKNHKELEYDLATIQDLLPYKLNGTYIGMDPDVPDPFYMKTLEGFGKLWENRDLFRFIQWIVPDPARSFASSDSVASCGMHAMTGPVADREVQLKKIIMTGIRSHASGLSIAPSFILPDSATLEYSPAEVLKLTDLFRDESQFFIRLQKYMQDQCPGQCLEYCLPWYNNELVDYSLGYADVFLAPLMDDMDKNVTFLWSGSSYYTVHTDAADVFRYSSLLNRIPVLLDNSMLTESKKACYGGSAPYYPHKVRLYNFLEPYSNDELHYYGDRVNKKRVFINQSVHSELDKIKILTALDFYWNMDAYDPDFSLWKILVSRYGRDAARELLVFGDDLAAILEITILLQQNDQVSKNFRTGNEILSSLKEHLDRITGFLGSDNSLVDELNVWYTETKDRFENLNPETVP